MCERIPCAAPFVNGATTVAQRTMATATATRAALTTIAGDEDMFDDDKDVVTGEYACRCLVSALPLFDERLGSKAQAPAELLDDWSDVNVPALPRAPPGAVPDFVKELLVSVE